MVGPRVHEANNSRITFRFSSLDVKPCVRNGGQGSIMLTTGTASQALKYTLTIYMSDFTESKAL